MQPKATVGRRKRILLMTAKCNPYGRSEAGAGWSRAVGLSRYSDVWTICSSDDEADIKSYLLDHKDITGLTFVFVGNSRFARFFQRSRPLYAVDYLSYYLWQRRAFKVAQRLHDEINFDLTHQVTISGYREPGFVWRLEVPFVWGPLGGTQNYPLRLLIHAGFAALLKEGLRSMMNWGAVSL